MTIDNSVLSKISSNELIARKLLTISFTRESLGDIRVLENDTFEKLEIGSKTYLAATLKVSDVIKNEGFQSIQVALSNVGGVLSRIIGENGDVITGANCLLEEVFLSDDGAVISNQAYPLFVGEANNLSVTQDQLIIDIQAILGGYSAISPNMTYGVNCQWRRFRDVNCAYEGDETRCDKTLTRCSELENLPNFGGFPSLPREQVIRA
ncbi:MAG: hypothetical protein WCF95_04205 [bacterium]